MLLSFNQSVSLELRLDLNRQVGENSQIVKLSKQQTKTSNKTI